MSKDGNAVAISIPRSLLQTIDDTLIRENLALRRKGSSADILGDILFQDKHVLFQPLLSLTPGLEYSVSYSGNQIGKISVPAKLPTTAPEVLGLYPTTDTVPENLLKIYIRFSAPMREGEALKHIFLINAEKDTLFNVFLDLQPELWNRERTVLTLWLDPGRIKRDLIPNKKMGNPLRTGQHYSLQVSTDWKDADDLFLKTNFVKQFLVMGRDSLGPEPSDWKIFPPAPGTIEPLKIKPGEVLDYFLLGETVTIWHGQTQITGSINITKKESAIEFVPSNKWETGLYLLRVATALEDLAGNNINRPFDRDMLTTKEKPQRDYDSVMFRVRGLP